MVEYITYKNEKYPIRVGYRAVKLTKLETGKTMDNIEDDITVLEPLLYYSLEAGHKALDKNFTLKREEIEWMLDECWLDFTAKMGQFFPKGNANIEKKSEVDFDELYGMAKSRLGMSLKEFYDCTPIELDWALKFYFKDRSEDWVRDRLNTFIIYSAFGGSEEVKKPEDLYPLSFDDEREIVIPQDVDWEGLERKYGGQQ